MKSIVILGTSHQYQGPESDPNLELEKPLGYLRSKFGAQIVMEEWAEKDEQSVVAVWAAKLNLPWANVGTPDEPQFRTYWGVISHPEHKGTLGWDPHAPPMYEYGPFEKQEAREHRMAKNVQAEMRNYETGLLIVGLGHMHSLFAKLLSAGFKVTGYSWLGSA
jgi:hypothetical protein